MSVATDASEMISEHKLVASICEESSYEFIKEFWSEIIDEPMVDNWHIELLCLELEKVARRVFARKPMEYDLLINIAPGTTKSTIVSVFFPIWCWTQKPWVQTICGSYGGPLSLDLSSKSRQIILSDKFRACFPNLRLRDDQNTKTFFQNEKGGWRYATSTGGAVTGKHGHIIIIDDPVDPRGAVSAADLKSANEWLTNVIPKRKVNQRNTVTIMIMQRLAQNDPSALWLEWKHRGLPIKHICLPAKLTDDVRPKKLRKYYVDGLMDPVRLPESVLEAQKMVGQYAYAGQYLQNPIPPEGGMFKTDMFSISTIAYGGKNWRLCRYWDKAGTYNDGAYTVGCLMGKELITGDFWVLDIVRGQWEAAERERIIKQTAQMDGKDVIIKVEREGGSGGKESGQATVRNLAGFRVILDLVGAASGNKIQRADPYSAQVNAGNVRMKQAVWNKEYLEELSFFPNSTYKDQVDASSGAFAHLSKGRLKIGGFKL